METQTLEQQVLSIIRNESGYFVEIDHCHPERLTDQDAAQIEQSASLFRQSITPEQVAEEVAEWAEQFAEMPEDQQALLIACHIMDSNADHGTYSSVSVYLTLTE